jgi:hypothetical protein
LLRCTTDTPSHTIYLIFAGFDDRHVVICRILFLAPKHSKVMQLLPSAVEVSERNKWLVDWIDECELVELFGLVSACATSIDEANVCQ